MPIEQLINLLFPAALAVCAGLRAFLPLLLIAVFKNQLHIVPPFDKLFTSQMMPVFFALALLEIIVDKFSFGDIVDNLFFLLRPIGSFLAIVSVTQVFPTLSGNVFVALFMSMAITIPVHITKVRSRILSRVKVYRNYNIISSLLEDGLALLGGIFAILAKAAAFPVLIILVYFVQRELNKSKLALIQYYGALELEKEKESKIKTVKKLKRLKKLDLENLS